MVIHDGRKEIGVLYFSLLFFFLCIRRVTGFGLKSSVCIKERKKKKTGRNLNRISINRKSNIHRLQIRIPLIRLVYETSVSPRGEIKERKREKRKKYIDKGFIT